MNESSHSLATSKDNIRRERSLEKIHTFDLKNHLRQPQKEFKDEKIVIKPGLIIADKRNRGSSAMPTPK